MLQIKWKLQLLYYIVKKKLWLLQGLEIELYIENFTIAITPAV